LPTIEVKQSKYGLDVSSKETAIQTHKAEYNINYKSTEIHLNR
jgi:hypothetical protein